MYSANHPLVIGAIVYPDMDQMDLTGPFEVLSRLPDCKVRLIWKSLAPVWDAHGFVITPDTRLDETPSLDLLIVPGGKGQQALMEDDDTLDFLQRSATSARYVLAVCTGTLICGAAGILRGLHATTHWSVFHLLGYFGAFPVRDRVVLDGKLITTAGVTAGIDGALRLASLVAGDRTAQRIQLSIEYDPSPPYPVGSPIIAPQELVDETRVSCRDLTNARQKTARDIASSFGYTRF